MRPIHGELQHAAIAIIALQIVAVPKGELQIRRTRRDADRWE